MFQPVMNGVGGNLVAVQASRISTSLHQSGSSLGRLPRRALNGEFRFLRRLARPTSLFTFPLPKFPRNSFFSLRLCQRLQDFFRLRLERALSSCSRTVSHSWPFDLHVYDLVLKSRSHVNNHYLCCRLFVRRASPSKTKLLGEGVGKRERRKEG